MVAVLMGLAWSDGAWADGWLGGDCLNGRGTYTWDDASKYVGECKNNLSQVSTTKKITEKNIAAKTIAVPGADSDF